MSSSSPSALSITTEQLFSRAGMGYLWTNKKDLDPGQVSHIDAMYKRKAKKSLSGKQTVTYKLAQNKCGKAGYGRLYGPVGSMEWIEREVRGTLCKDYYYDLDIVNCHPTLLAQIVSRKLQMDTPELDRYNSNRDHFLSTICDGDRELAKTEVLKVLYNGRSEALQPLSKEMKQICQRLWFHPSYSELADLCSTADNKYGSFLSYLVQTEERKIMLCMKQFLEENKWSVDVLCFDGVMIRKDPNQTFSEDLLKELEVHISLKTGYNVQIKNKEFEFFDIPPVDEEIVPGVKNSEYLEMKALFEENHFYYIPNNRYGVYSEGNFQLIDLEHAKARFMSKWYFRTSDRFSDKVLFFDIWRTDENRREINKIDFRPSDDPMVFVVPLKFNYQTLPSPSDPTPFLNIFNTLLDINTNYNPELRDYLLKYLAHLLQKPLELPRVGLLITGAQGCGKDTLFDFVGTKLLGDLYFTNYKPDGTFFEKHDTGKENKFLVKQEEADPSDCRKNAPLLKSLITSLTLSVNPKGQPITNFPNYLRIVFTTNKGNPLELDQDDRRWVMLVASPRYVGKMDHWQHVQKILFTDEGARAVADYLLSVDISQFDPSIRPITTFQREVLETELTSEDRFIQQWDGSIVSSLDFYNMYREFCITNNYRYAQSSIAFGKRLLPYIRDNKIQKVRRNDGPYYQKVGVMGVMG